MGANRPGLLVAIGEPRCLELLATAEVVRVAFTTHEGPTIVPVNHLLHDGAVYFRTAPGSKLGAAAAAGPVALEADHWDAATRTAWSVVAHGHATIVTTAADVEALLALPFDPWVEPGERPFWVRVSLESLSGRELRRPLGE